MLVSSSSLPVVDCFFSFAQRNKKFSSSHVIVWFTLIVVYVCMLPKNHQIVPWQVSVFMDLLLFPRM